MGKKSKRNYNEFEKNIKIFLITSNRSEYGILRNLIQNFKKIKKIKTKFNSYWRTPE